MYGLAHRVGRGAVQHDERGIVGPSLKRPPKHFGRETRTAHAAQHDFVAVRADAVGEVGEIVVCFEKALGDVEPAEPVM